MAFVFSNCKNCSSQYRTRKMLKQRDIGVYKGHLVTETYYTCPTCNHDNQVSISHPLIEKAYQKAFMAEWYVHINRLKDDYDKCVKEFELAEKKLNKTIRMIMEEITYEIH